MGMLSRAQSRGPKRVKIEIDEGIYAALQSIGQMREVEADKIIEMQLLSYIRAYERGQVFGPSDPMPYGKYKGYIIEEIVRVDPRYICWMISESPVFKVNDEVIELLNSLKGDDEELFTYDEAKPKDINDG